MRSFAAVLFSFSSLSLKSPCSNSSWKWNLKTNFMTTVFVVLLPLLSEVSVFDMWHFDNWNHYRQLVGQSLITWARGQQPNLVKALRQENSGGHRDWSGQMLSSSSPMYVLIILKDCRDRVGKRDNLTASMSNSYSGLHLCSWKYDRQNWSLFLLWKVCVYHQKLFAPMGWTQWRSHSWIWLYRRLCPQDSSACDPHNTLPMRTAVVETLWLPKF